MATDELERQVLSGERFILAAWKDDPVMAANHAGTLDFRLNSRTFDCPHHSAGHTVDGTRLRRALELARGSRKTLSRDIVSVVADGEP